MAEYVELQCHTHYSFLRGAGHPKEYIDAALELGLKGLAITDLHGVYGLPKAYSASQSFPHFQLIAGAQVKVGEYFVTLLAQNRKAYGTLCQLLTQAHDQKEKGQAFLTQEEFKNSIQNMGNLGLIALPDLQGNWEWDHLHALFPKKLYLPLSRFLTQKDSVQTKQALSISQEWGIPIVATNSVHTPSPKRKPLQDVLTSIREGVPLEKAGHLLFSNQERYLKSPEQMSKLFYDLPKAIQNTLKIADECTFSLSELKYQYPSEWIPKNETAHSYLSKLVWTSAHQKYRSLLPIDVKAQLEKELKIIDEMKFADYFLTIWEIVEFAREKKILCQGRGSAANSAVCFVLGITAIDPVRMNLLFERFISTERGEPPDIDVDFEHERREEVIQHIYQKYGRHRSAMVSAVVTYRSKSAIREVTKAFGQEMDKRDFQVNLETNPTESLLLQKSIIDELMGFPRHLSIHSGGFTLSADSITSIVPVEPARMEDRTIIQWDKYDLDILGLLKIDVLSLGILTAIRKTLDLVGNLSLDTIPSEDSRTYQMIQRADTIGTFQIESRAQMSMLPRLLPTTFYDLVVEVALVRPGPIVGKMVHPYLKRRKGLESIALPDPRLEPILGRTLGVPIFQEQVMKMAIILADFSPGEADQLRRAIGAWRSSGSIDEMGHRLMRGLKKNGIPDEFSEQIFNQIQGFAEYGFPESHAASFALLAYATSYLKCHHPAEYTCGLLNSQPMGFYAPHTLIDDAKRHGVIVLPIHPNISQWDCILENKCIRIGFRYIHGVNENEIIELVKERSITPFKNLSDFIYRSHLQKRILHRLALGNAFECFGLNPRSALWEILYLELIQGKKQAEQLSLFSTLISPSSDSSFTPPQSFELIQGDYEAFRLSSRGHPMQFIREKYPDLPHLTTFAAKQFAHGKSLKIFGLSIVMQRPPTAAGTVFATLEDETGLLDLIIHKACFEKHQNLILEQGFLLVTGQIQKEGLSVSLIVRKLSVLPAFTPFPDLQRHLSYGVTN